MSHRSDVKQPARRMRKALSCTQCKDRKIKCDRNVPRCSSCVVRGIERTCRWGDERDEDVTARATKAIRLMAGDENGGGGRKGAMLDRKRSLESSADVGGNEVESIVEAVLKRLKRNGEDRSSSSSSSSTRSSPTPSSSRKSRHDHLQSASEQLDDILAYNIRPPRMINALIRPVSAFSGASKYHPLYVGANDGDLQLDPDRIRQTLRCLPAKDICQALIEMSLRELLYYRAVFNIVILRQQLDEFWQGMEELEVRPTNRSGTLRKQHNLQIGDSGILASMSLSAAQTPSVAPSPSKEKKHFFLCSRIRQGLIGLIFAILDAAARSLSRETLLQYEIITPEDDADANLEFSETMNELSVYHLSISNYALQPTLWTLQALYLSQGRWLNIRTAGRSMASRGAMVSLAVSMGLNLLGSAYDDLDNMDGDEDGGLDLTRNTFSGGPWQNDVEDTQGKVKGPNLLTDSRYSASLVVFEAQNLALRELGRKIWCSITLMDWIIAGHLDHFYSIHDSVSHTAPPVPVDDADILSPRAPFFLAKARMGTHKPSQSECAAINFALARATRAQVDLENTKGYPLPYEDILTLDGLIRQVMNAMPACLKIKRIGFWEQTYGHQMAGRIDKRDMAMQTAMLQDQIHFRRLRLHRQFFGKGLKDSRYRASVDACLLAARMILDARIEVEEHKMLMFSSFVMKSHLFHAALVFQLSLLYELDRRRTSEQRRSGKEAHDADLDEDVDEFRLDDFDQTLARLEKAVDFLRQDAHVRMTTDLLPGLDAFLQGVHDLRIRQRAAASSVKRRPSGKRESVIKARGTTTTASHDRDSQHTDAANILASIPVMSKGNSPGVSAGQRSSPLQMTTPTSLSTVTSDPSINSRDSTAWPTNTAPSTSSSSSWYHAGQYPAAQQQQSGFQAAASNPLPEAFDPNTWSLEALVPDYAAGQVDLFEALERSFFGGGGGAAGASTIAAQPGNAGADNVSVAQSILNVPLSIDTPSFPFPAVNSSHWFGGVANS